jgi:CHAD domain-containing protein
MESNLSGAVVGTDPEFLHDFRVAVRRSRSVQRQLKRVFPPGELEHFRAEFKWVQRATSDARDLDVHLTDFEEMRALVPDAMRADLDPLKEALGRRRSGARVRMVAELGSERLSTLRSGWSTLLEKLPSLPGDDRPAAAKPIVSVAGQRIEKVYGKIVEQGRTIDEHGPSEPFHELRKRGKELRYLLELFGGPLYPAEVINPMVKALKALQNVLGRHQDREVQVAMLRSLDTELAGDHSALVATGELIAQLDRDKLVAREEFAGRFDRFASGDQQTLVKTTFA